MCDGYLSSSPPPPRSHSYRTGSKASKPLSRRALASAVRQLHAPGPSARLLSPSPYLNDDVACFDFFRFRMTTAVSESRGQPLNSSKGFWNCTLLQASHAEPAVWHAVAALGALYRKWEVASTDSGMGRVSFQSPPRRYLDDADWSTGSSVDGECDSRCIEDLDSHSVRLTAQAGTCYTTALNLAKSVHDVSSMLVLSLALATIANLSGKWLDSSVHYQAGQKLMSQLRREAPGKAMTDLQMHASESLAKLGLQLLSFQEQSAPSPYAEIQQVGVSSSGEPFPRSLVSSQDQRGWGLRHANVKIVDIIRRILNEAGRHTAGNLPAPLDDNHKQVQLAITRDLEAWQLDTCHVLSNTADSRTDRTTLDLLSVKLLHTLARLLIASNVMRPDMHTELSWDAHLVHFDRILALSVLILRTERRQNPLSLSVMSLDEPKLNMALWLTATRCRHPVMRRRALQLLRGARRLEGVWMSTSAAAAAEKMIAIEEERGLVNELLLARLPRWSATEPALIAEIEAEDYEPRSWLWPEAGCARTTASQWDVPGEMLVPLERRITNVDVTGEYDPHVGMSRGDLTLLFAERDEQGALRRERVSVYF